jgi:hypothetical protein
MRNRRRSQGRRQQQVILRMKRSQARENSFHRFSCVVNSTADTLDPRVTRIRFISSRSPVFAPKRLWHAPPTPESARSTRANNSAPAQPHRSAAQLPRRDGPDLQQPRRLLDSANRLRMHLRPNRRHRRKADPQPPRLTQHRLRIRLGRRRNHKRIPRLRTLQDIQRQSRIPHATRNHPFARRPKPHLANPRPGRHPPARRPQGKQATASRRNPQRPAAIVPGRHRHDARSDGRRRAAAGTARRPRQIPGIIRAPEQLGIGHPANRKLGQIRLAEDDQPAFR